MSTADSYWPVLLGVDEDGRAEAWVATRPGCVVFAASAAEAVSQVPAAAAEYDVWLARWGLVGIWDIPTIRPTKGEANQTDVRILERVPVAERVIQGNTAAFFQWDAQAVNTEEIDATLRLLKAPRQELLAVLGQFQPDKLSLRPGGGHRTVEDIVRHVATVEWWYMSRIVPFPAPDDGEYPQDLEGLLGWIRERVAQRLLGLSDEERGRISVPDPDSGERWSARKVLRRLIYHELYRAVPSAAVAQGAPVVTAANQGCHTLLNERNI